MMARALGRRINALLHPLGLEIHRTAAPATSLPEISLNTALGHLRRTGFTPSTVIDVGAAFGSFARDCACVFPRARYFLFEPLCEFHPALRALVNELHSGELFPFAAASSSGTRVLHVHPDLVGSSFYLENEDSDVNGVERTVTVESLDAVLVPVLTPGPCLLKIDTQGAELEVLQGASAVLRQTEVAILEISLFQFFEGGPLLHEMVAFMADSGLLVYDVAGLTRRPLDGALAQLDIVFARKNGPLRAQTRYATRGQREVQTKAFRAAMQRDGAGSGR